jgi:hypothetical protein
MESKSKAKKIGKTVMDPQAARERYLKATTCEICKSSYTEPTKFDHIKSKHPEYHFHTKDKINGKVKHVTIICDDCGYHVTSFCDLLKNHLHKSSTPPAPEAPAAESKKKPVDQTEPSAPVVNEVIQHNTEMLKNYEAFKKDHPDYSFSIGVTLDSPRLKICCNHCDQLFDSYKDLLTHGLPGKKEEGKESGKDSGMPHEVKLEDIMKLVAPLAFSPGNKPEKSPEYLKGYLSGYKDGIRDGYGMNKPE